MNRHWPQACFALQGLALLIGCGAGDWKVRLQERFEQTTVEHPLVDEARKAHQRALVAEQAKQEDQAQMWALAADHFLSAAIVRDKNARLQEHIAERRAKVAALETEVAELELALTDRFASKKNTVRSLWLEDAKRQAYEHAADYEAKRFRARNQDVVRLKVARDELMTLARLHLQGAQALNPSLNVDKLARAVHMCARGKPPLMALDCINQLRWKIRELFTEAQRSVGLTAQDTLALQTFLRSQQVPFRWQNDALAILEAKGSTKAWRAVVTRIVGPVQVHAARAQVPRLQNKLRDAGLTKNRLATPVTDDNEDNVIYLLAYPRPATK